MAQNIIPDPSPDAFQRGALNLDYMQSIVDAVNLPIEFKGGGGKVVYSEENIALVLDGGEELCYIVKNGEIRKCFIRIRFA